MDDQSQNPVIPTTPMPEPTQPTMPTPQPEPVQQPGQMPGVPVEVPQAPPAPMPEPTQPAGMPQPGGQMPPVVPNENPTGQPGGQGVV